MDLNIRCKTEFIPYIGIGMGFERIKKTDLNDRKRTISVLLPFIVVSVSV